MSNAFERPGDVGPLRRDRRYRIRVAQILNDPRGYEVEATFVNERRGGVTLVFARDDGTTFEVHYRALLSAVPVIGTTTKKADQP